VKVRVSLWRCAGLSGRLALRSATASASHA